jgi:hypothetical protein
VTKVTITWPKTAVSFSGDDGIVRWSGCGTGREDVIVPASKNALVNQKAAYMLGKVGYVESVVRIVSIFSFVR